MKSVIAARCCFLLCILAAVGRWAVTPAHAWAPPNSGPLRVVSHRVQDLDGDQDGYPDTGESVDLYITVWNATGQDITNVTALATTDDPKIDCLLPSPITLALLPANATVELATPFRIRVRDSADRSGTVPPAICAGNLCSNGAGPCTSAAQCQKTVLDDYAAILVISLSGDQASAATQTLALTLDLNVSNASATAPTYVEGFEAGFGSFTLMNLDNNVATNALSNGMRCQYTDPDFPASNSFGATECFLGFAVGQSPVNDWHVHLTTSSDGGRAFLGSSSLHYGKHTSGSPGLDTYGLSQLDAIRTKNNLNLAARICAALQGGLVKSCNNASSCTNPASACISASPVLSFKQQVSTVDSRGVTSLPPGQAIDAAVVQVQLNNSTRWQEQYPYQNVYDAQRTDVFNSCRFDPTDDGNDEDSYFHPSEPNRRLGPSSTCFPEFVFSYLGDTDDPFQAANIGNASDGPGLQGSLGIGTWVESRFDLSRYRGRTIRMRYLFTSIKITDPGRDYGTYEDYFTWNPNPADDGWYIDDVRVTQTLGTAAPTVTSDTAAAALLVCPPAGGSACGGASPCDDSNPCTLDGCIAGVGCVHVNSTASCDDGNSCTTGDTCAAGVCAGSAVTDGTACEDGNPCTANDHCTGGDCGGTIVESPNLCDDSDPCTLDSCSPTQGCMHAPGTGNACDDGQACTYNDVCAAGTCGGTAIVCTSDFCATRSCNGTSACTVTAIHSGQICDDHNGCTGAFLAPDHCSSGVCVSGGPTNCNDNNVCTTDSCVPAVGCIHAANTLACDDGMGCTAGDACSNGACAGSPSSNFFPCGSLRFGNKTTLTWPSANPGGVELIYGDLLLLRTNGGQFNTTVLTCIADDTTSASATDATVPGAGGAPRVLYYLARRSVPDTSWTSTSIHELPGAGGTRDVDLDGPPKAANTCTSPP